MIRTGDKQQMPHTPVLQLIDQGREISQRVLGSVIEFNTLCIQPLFLNQPGCIFRIAATTDQQR
tara:strand:+ start:671 stop:862 length:192 start_codon:yes stop_codon:yes gene_type:complete